jgi:hypothetical protein
MSTKRTPIGRRPQAPRITDDMVALFRRAMSIQRAGKHDTLEEDAGFKREYMEACCDLQEMADRRPWQADAITDVSPVGFEQPTDPNPDADLPGAIRLRRALEALS